MLVFENGAVYLKRYEIQCIQKGIPLIMYAVTDHQRDLVLRRYPDAIVTPIDQSENEWIDGMTFNSLQEAKTALVQGISYLINRKLSEISATCQAAIHAGFDLETENGVEHFSLTVENQANINSLFKIVEFGGAEYPYHADDGECRIYSAQEILNIYLNMQTIITTQLSYHNALKAYVLTLEDADAVAQVQYGMELPEPFLTKLHDTLAVAQAQLEVILARIGGTAT